MSVRVNLNEETKLYELGDDVDGVFIAFVTLPVTAVEGRIASVLEHREANAGAATETSPPTAATGAYVDNGDGTWTRESDGVKGSFGPDGFAETPAA
jgi:hypothetical protein